MRKQSPWGPRSPESSIWTAGTMERCAWVGWPDPQSSEATTGPPSSWGRTTGPCSFTCHPPPQEAQITVSSGKKHTLSSCFSAAPRLRRDIGHCQPNHPGLPGICAVAVPSPTLPLLPLKDSFHLMSPSLPFSGAQAVALSQLSQDTEHL